MIHRQYRAALVALSCVAACSDATAPGRRPPTSASYDLVFETSSSSASNQRELYRTHGTGAATPFIAAGTFGSHPQSSADGRWIVYIGSGTNDVSGDLWVAAADGSGAHRLFPTADGKSQPALSPNAQQVAWVKYDLSTGASQLMLANVDGTQGRPLTVSIPEITLGHGRAAWSPDGTRLALSYGTPGQLDLYVGAPSATAFTRLTNTATSDIEPSWSPDGRYIVFSRVMSPARSDLVIIDVVTKTERTLGLPGSNRQPAWSPDGTRIAFSSTLDAGGDHEIYVITPDGTGLTRVTDNDVNDRYPAWVRNG
jgi:Tol biopolymer transport system component